LQPLQSSPGIAVQETIIPCPPEALGQHMLEDPPEEPDDWLGQGVPVTRVAVLILQAHLLPIVVQDVLFPQHAPVKVAGQIGERLFTLAHVFALGNPFFGQLVREGEALFLESGQEFAPEHPGQRLAVEQIMPGPGLPLMAVEAAAGHHEMHMGMEGESPGMSVQHPHQSRATCLMAFWTSPRSMTRGWHLAGTGSKGGWPPGKMSSGWRCVAQ